MRYIGGLDPLTSAVRLDARQVAGARRMASAGRSVREGRRTRPIGISAFEDKGPKPSKGSNQLVAVLRLAWNAWTLSERGATAPQLKVPSRFRPDIECVF